MLKLNVLPDARCLIAGTSCGNRRTAPSLRERSQEGAARVRRKVEPRVRPDALVESQALSSARFAPEDRRVWQIDSRPPRLIDALGGAETAVVA